MSIQNLLQLTHGGLGRPSIRAGARLTEDLWNEAHAEHREQLLLHASGVHGSGVVTGLQVTATEPPSRFVTIHPGAAIDPLGRLVVITENDQDRAFRLFQVDVGKAGWVHILLEYRDDLTVEPGDASNNYVRVQEYAHCIASLEPPAAHQIELARVFISQDARPVTDARDPLRPGVNELDCRFRNTIGSAIRGEVVIGQVFHAKPRERTHWDVYRVGLSLLTRRMQADGPFQARYLPLVRLTGDEEGCTLLHLSGGASLALTPEQVDQLRTYLAAGGVLFAESNQIGFEKAARDLAGQLGVQLAPLPPAHPLLTAHHVFSAPPPGGKADAGGLFCGTDPSGKGVMLLSSRDYGSAWEGADGLDRGRIRDAQEFGVNLGAFATEYRQSGRLERFAPPELGTAGSTG